MNKEIQYIISMLKETYEGDPWHGRSIKALLDEVSPETGLKKPSAGSHSIAELVYHMVNWRDFTISRLRPEAGQDVAYFETNDWRTLDHNDIGTWKRGLELLEESQQKLVAILEEYNDSILPEPVSGRKYNFRTLLYGVVHHDIYHAGQIAYAWKLLDQ